MVQEYRTGQWLVCVWYTYIGIVLRSPMEYYGIGVQDRAVASLCVVHIGIVLHSRMECYGTGVLWYMSTGQNSGI